MVKKIIVMFIIVFSTKNFLMAKISGTIEQFNKEISEPYFLEFDNKVTNKFTTYGYKKNGIQVYLTVNKDQKIIQEMIIIDDSQYGLYLMSDGYPTSENYRAKYSIMIALREIFKDAVSSYLQNETIDGLSLESVIDEIYDTACYGEQYNRSINGIRITSKEINGIISIGIELISDYD